MPFSSSRTQEAMTKIFLKLHVPFVFFWSLVLVALTTFSKAFNDHHTKIRLKKRKKSNCSRFRNKPLYPTFLKRKARKNKGHDMVNVLQFTVNIASRISQHKCQQPCMPTFVKRLRIGQKEGKQGLYKPQRRCSLRSTTKRENVSRISTPNGISTSVGSLPFGKKDTLLPSPASLTETLAFE